MRPPHHRLPSRLFALFACTAALLSLTLTATVIASDADRTLEGDAPKANQSAIKPNPLVAELIDDPLTGEAERRRVAWFHGRWQELENPTPTESAHIALMTGDWGAAVFENETVDARLRAEAALLRGEPSETLELLGEDPSVQADYLRAQAWVMLGQMAKAVAVLDAWRTRLQRESFNDPAALTAAAQGLFMLAALEGRPAGEYKLAVGLLGRARGELDRLYWPALVAEAEALLARGNRSEAGEATLEALALNPRAASAWRVLGELSYSSFNFDQAANVVQEIRAFAPDHPLADIVEAGSYLQQLDADSAQKVLEPALADMPRQPELLALRAAMWALQFEPDRTEEALSAFDQVAPGSDLALATVGKYLARARQYEQSEAMLRRAIARQPNSAHAATDLGWVLMQAGRVKEGRSVLARATQIDPFHVRAANSLKLAEAMLDWETIETEHFIIRYQPGIDAVLARDMPELLEQFHAQLVETFEYEPKVKTQVDLMPDEKWFGVRITGMPDIWTIAAATGPVIAMTPPRIGKKQRGDFHWSNVMRHEYVHTVTLEQTKNRIPHWFTEACAVLQEENPRPWSSAQLLAQAYHNDKLFPLAEINWGFVRPKTPQDRPLAYAQAAWMLEYLIKTHGKQAMVDLLTLFGQGVSDTAGIEQVTGESAETFMENFKAWAGTQLELWGLTPHENEKQIMQELRKVKGNDVASLAELDAIYPDHPQIVQRLAQARMAGDDVAAAERAVQRYALLRPLDPWADRALARLAVEQGDPAKAIRSFERLDITDGGDGDWAEQLSAIHRSAGRLDEAAKYAQRALTFTPYDGTRRETAATIDLQRGDMQSALHHLSAMPLLEPGRAIHHVRLAAVYARLGEPDKARNAAERALELDPQAPVQRFLGSR